MDAVFLGMNEAGQEVYNWLNTREDINIKALLTEKTQLELIKTIQPEIIISSGFEHKVPQEIIEIPGKGVINLHPSFLPYNKGSHPYIWPIIDGTPAGVSIHYMNAEIDEGPIIAKREVPVYEEDTGEKLHQRLMHEQAELFKQKWVQIKEEKIDSKKQDPDQGTKHFRKDLEKLREIETSEKIRAEEFIDKLRALTYPPHQNAYIEKNGVKYFLNLELIPENYRNNSTISSSSIERLL